MLGIIIGSHQQYILSIKQHFCASENVNQTEQAKWLGVLLFAEIVYLDSECSHNWPGVVDIIMIVLRVERG